MVGGIALTSGGCIVFSREHYNHSLMPKHISLLVLALIAGVVSTQAHFRARTPVMIPDIPVTGR